MKSSFALLILLILSSSCLMSGSTTQDVTPGTGWGGNNPPTESTHSGLSSESTIRSFDEIAGMYSSLTGISLAEWRVRSELERVRISLPMDGKVESLSGFNQIAISSLAFAFCELWIRKHITGTGNDTAIFGIKKVGNPNYQDELLDAFISKLAFSKEEDDLFWSDAGVREAYKSFMISDTSTVMYHSNSTTRYQLEGMMGCAAFLSSAYFTLDGF